MSWDAVMEKVRDYLEKIRNKFDEFVNKINSILSKVPGWAERLLDGFNELWDKMIAKLDEFWDWTYSKLQYAGNLPTLSDARESWLDSVGDPVHNAARTVEEGDLSVDNPDRWQGKAAEAYAGKISDQQTAMELVPKTYATAVAAALDAAHDGIRNFWVGVGVGLVVLYGAFVTAVLAAATIVAAVTSPGFIIGGLGGFLASSLIGYNSLDGNMQNAKSNLDTAFRYNTDAWPSFAV